MAWVFSAVAILLATALVFTGRSVCYDPMLAILTSTLVILVWYTYFTYRLNVSAESSLRHAHEILASQQRSNLLGLHLLVSDLQRFVEKLPLVDRGFDTKITVVELWEDRQLEQLRHYTQSLGLYESLQADAATGLMRFLAKWTRDCVWWRSW